MRTFYKLPPCPHPWDCLYPEEKNLIRNIGVGRGKFIVPEKGFNHRLLAGEHSANSWFKLV